ncbi:MAG: TVP38/TMEM64 family protein [Alphaproteobacteria bacterium]|nr:TVP38/TMEM64 family protein [Alphaproteobacteria bacterium]
MIRTPRWLRATLLAALAVALGAAIVYRQQVHPEWLADVIDDYPAVMPLAFVVVHVAASLLFVPRNLMAMVAGGLFGGIGGGVISIAGAMAGAMAGFWTARYLNADLLHVEDLPRIGPLIAKAERGGLRFVMVTRLLPVLPHALVNYVFGLSAISVRDYALGSLLGFIPQTIAFVKLGQAGAGAASGAFSIETMLWAVGLLALSFLVPRLVPRRWR